MSIDFNDLNFDNLEFRRTTLNSVSSLDALDPNSYGFQKRLKERLEEANKRKQERLEMRNLFDPFLNKEGQKESVKYFEKLFNKDFNEKNPVVRTVAGYGKLVDNLYFGAVTKFKKLVTNDIKLNEIKLGQELGSNLLNWLYFVGDTMDFLSFFVKSGIIAGQENISYAKALEMSFGTGDSGRHRMDFERIAKNSEFWGDGFFPVMLGEMITDPLLIFAIGKGIAKSVGKAAAVRVSKTMTRNVDELMNAHALRKFSDVSKDAFKAAVNKLPDELIDEATPKIMKLTYRLDQAVKYGDRDEFLNVLSRIKKYGLTDGETTILAKSYSVNAAKFKANGAMRFLTAMDNIENATIKTIGKANPMIGATRQLYRGGRYITRKLTGFADVTKAREQFIATSERIIISEYNKLNTDNLKTEIEQLKIYIDDAYSNGAPIEEIIKLTDLQKEAMFILSKKEANEIIQKTSDDLKTLKNLRDKLQVEIDKMGDEPTIYNDLNKVEARIKDRIKQVKSIDEQIASVKKEQQLQEDIYFSKIVKEKQVIDKNLDEAIRVYEGAQKDLENFKKLYPNNKGARYTQKVEAFKDAYKRLEDLNKRKTKYDNYYDTVIKNKQEADEYINNQLSELNKSLENTKTEIDELYKERDAIAKTIDESTDEFLGQRGAAQKKLRSYNDKINELNMEVEAHKNHWEILKRTEARLKNIDVSDTETNKWLKYGDEEGYKKLLKEIKDKKELRSKLVTEQVAKPEIVKALQSEIQLLNTYKKYIDDLLYMIHHSEKGTEQAKTIGYFLNKKGNDNLRIVLRKFAKDRVASYEFELNKFKKFYEDFNKLDLKELEKSLDEAEFDKFIDGYKSKHERMIEEIDRLKKLVDKNSLSFGESVIKDPPGYKGFTKEYNDFLIKVYGNKYTQEQKDLMDMYEISLVFETWFNSGEYELSIRAYDDMIEEARHAYRQADLENDIRGKKEFSKRIEQLKARRKSHENYSKMQDKIDNMKKEIAAFEKKSPDSIKNYYQLLERKKQILKGYEEKRSMQSEDYLTKLFKQIDKEVYKAKTTGVSKNTARVHKITEKIYNSKLYLLGHKDEGTRNKYIKSVLDRFLSLNKYKKSMTKEEYNIVAADVSDRLSDALEAIDRFDGQKAFDKLQANENGSAILEVVDFIVNYNAIVDGAKPKALKDFLEKIDNKPFKKMIYHMLQIVPKEDYGILSLARNNPHRLMTYLGLVHNNHAFAAEIAHLTASKSLFDKFKKTDFEGVFREVGGKIEFRRGAYKTKDERLFLHAYNLMDDFINELMPMQVMSPKLAENQFKKVEKELANWTRVFKKLRLFEHMMAFDELTEKAVSVEALQRIISKKAGVDLEDFVQMYHIRDYMAAYVKNVAIRNIKETGEAILKGTHYKEVFNIGKHLTMLKAFKIPRLTQAIEIFETKVRKPYFGALGNRKKFYRIIVENAPSEAPKDPDKIIKFYLEEIDDLLRRAMSGVEQNYFKKIGEQLDALEPIDEARKQFSHLFKNYTSKGSDTFSKTPFDSIADADANATLSSTFKYLNRDDVKAKITVDKKGNFYIDGKRAKKMIFDAETQPMFDEYGNQIDEAFQISIKGDDGTNKIYWIKTASGTLDKDVQEFTGITNDFYQEILKTGRKNIDVFENIEDAKAAIARDFGDHSVFIAHNSAFDASYMPDSMLDSTINMDSLPFLRLLYAKEFNRFGLEHIASKKINKKVLKKLKENIRKRVNLKVQESKQLNKVGFHNANFDTEILYEVLFKKDENGVSELTKIFKKYNIDNLNDLNSLDNLLFSEKQAETIDNFLKVIDDYRVNPYSKISELDEDNFNYNESQLFRQVEELTDHINELFNNLIGYKNKKVDLKKVIAISADMDDVITDIDYLIKNSKMSNRDTYVKELNQIDDDTLEYIEKIMGVSEELSNLFRVVSDNQKAILDSFYGNATGTLMRSKMAAHFELLSGITSNNGFNDLLDVFAGRLLKEDSGAKVDISKKLMFVKMRMLGDSTLTSKQVKTQFADKYPNHPLVKLEKYLQEIDDYAHFQDDVWNMLEQTDSFIKADEHMKPVIRQSFFDLMYAIDKSLYRMNVNNKMDLDSLMLEFNRLAIQTGANKYIKMSTKLDTRAYNIVDRDVIEYLRAHVIQKFNAIADGNVEGPARILLNPDTELTNNLYHTLKRYFTDVQHRIDSGTTNEKIFDSNGKIIDIKTDILSGALTKQMNEFFTDAIDEIRQGLRNIKIYNREQSLNPVHIGNLRKQMYETLYKSGGTNVQDSVMSHWRNADISDESALTTLGAKNVFKLSKSSKEVYQTRKMMYDFLNGLTPSRKTLQEMGEEAKLSGDGVWFKDLNMQESGFYKIIEDVFSALNYDGSIIDFLKYAKSNTIKSPFRGVKKDIIDNLIMISQREVTGSNAFNDVATAWSKMEDWAKHPFTSYLKKDRLDVDPKMLQEFELRFKGAMYDFLFKTDGVKFSEEMSKAYDEVKIKVGKHRRATKGMSERLIKNSQTQFINTASKHFGDSYKNLRALFFDDTDKGIQDFIKFLKNNNLVLSYQEQTSKGIRVMKFDKLDVKTVREFDEMFKSAYGSPFRDSRLNQEFWKDSVSLGKQTRQLNFGVIDKHQYQTLQKALHQFRKFPEGTIESILRRSLLAPLKVISLFNFAFTLGNAVDITLKNVKEAEGGMTQSYTLIGNTWRAMKAHSLYNDYYRKAMKELDFSLYDNYNAEWVDAYRRLLSSQGLLNDQEKANLKMVEFVHEFLNTEAAASEVNQMLLRMSLNKIGKYKRDNAWDTMVNKIFFSKLGSETSMNFNPFSANLQLNGWLEVVGRMGLHLDDLEKGLTKNESLAKILKTHFNYSNKSHAEMYAEFMVPFISYPLRSFEYWSEALFEKGVETRLMFKSLEVAWGDELDDNSYAQYQMSRGNIPVGNTALQTGFTFMDAMQMSNVSGEYGPLPDQLMRKINPIIKNMVTDPAFGKVSQSEGLSRMPIYSHGRKALNIPTAFEKGTVTDLFPAITDPYYRGSFNNNYANFSYRNYNASKPTSSNTVSFRTFGKYAYSPIERLNYKMTNTSKYYRK